MTESEKNLAKYVNLRNHFNFIVDGESVEVYFHDRPDGHTRMQKEELYDLLAAVVSDDTTYVLHKDPFDRVAGFTMTSPAVEVMWQPKPIDPTVRD